MSMTTPIVDFVRSYAKSGTARLHMPGHKGQSLLGFEPLDITEICGADELYAPEGIIAESEANATRLFGTVHSYYSTEGSSQCIRAMLFLALQGAPQNGKRPVLLAARNAHKALLYAAALLDFDIRWLWPSAQAEGALCSCPVTAEALTGALHAMAQQGNTPFGVYVTSPDYLGGVQDIPALAAVCRAQGVPLLVDNAHGAYLRFLPQNCHPIAQGAAMCCDSAHKTLPCLTGCAYLHAAHEEDVPRIKDAMSMFVSTSPSYLMLLSLDVCNAYLAGKIRSDLERICKRAAALKKRLSEKYVFLDGDPLHLTVDAAASKLDGLDLAARLERADCVPEYADRETVVLLLSPYNVPEELDVLEVTLHMIVAEPYPETESPEILLPQPEVVCNMREAALGAQEVIPVAKSIGRICAAVKVPCPPAVPIVCSGERIDAQSAAVLQHYGISEIAVVKEADAEESVAPVAEEPDSETEATISEA